MSHRQAATALVIWALGSALALTGCSNEATATPPDMAPSASATARDDARHGEPLSLADIVGEWRPDWLLGEDVRDVRTVDGLRSTFAFHIVERLAGGDDGCNTESFHYRLGPGDRFTARFLATTLRRCDDVRFPYAEVMRRATRVRIVGTELHMIAHDGTELAMFSRAVPAPRWVAKELNRLRGR